ncbi:hypothetical protein [Bacillus atrophaeus]|uniref:hypothetical protein n=1 Tax=Bacillus atrophaeus TaxID=1452 RepID=UPI00227DC298|nr:hypothetical protein [Bacillus atrophaeus]MCY8504522.1 hypothetical protein [Bacillus atrophaeus]MCY8966114.1 hypothetical protein [Bacillus atrophaeus]
MIESQFLAKHRNLVKLEAFCIEEYTQMLNLAIKNGDSEKAAKSIEGIQNSNRMIEKYKAKKREFDREVELISVAKITADTLEEYERRFIRDER